VLAVTTLCTTCTICKNGQGKENNGHSLYNIPTRCC
jgi:hypothetical protein